MPRIELRDSQGKVVQQAQAEEAHVRQLSGHKKDAAHYDPGTDTYRRFAYHSIEGEGRDRVVVYVEREEGNGRDQQP